MANQLSRAAYNQQRAMQRGLLGRGEIPDTSLLGRFAEDARTPGAASGFAKGLLSGAVGLPADVLSLMNMPLAASPYNAGAQKLQGLLQPFTSDGIAEKLGADPNRMTTQAGLIGAPDPGDIGKVAMRAGQDGLLGAMTLFHGTPHKFDNFDLEAIGTGEGAQAYGHGLYFAEDPAVAGHYRTPQNSIMDIDNGNIVYRMEVDGEIVQPGSVDDRAAKYINEHGDLAAAEAETFFDLSKVPDDQDAVISRIKELQSNKVPVKQVQTVDPGHLYEVDIPDDTIGKMLDWDAPLSEQPESVQRALGFDKSELNKLQRELKDLEAQIDPATFDESRLADKIRITERRLKEWSTNAGFQYRQLVEKLGSQEAASEALRNAGIPGIRYFDGGSRGTGEGTRNIVVFNPEDIREVKRDGEIVARQGLLDVEAINGTDFLRGITGQADDGRRVGEYFTDAESIAMSYIAPNVAGEKGKVSGKLIKARFNLKDPLIVDMGGKLKDDAADAKYFRQAQESGKDAVVFVNVRDGKSAGQRVGSAAYDNTSSKGMESTVVVPLKESALPSTLESKDVVLNQRPPRPKDSANSKLLREADEYDDLAKDYFKQYEQSGDNSLKMIAEAFVKDAQDRRLKAKNK